MITLLSRKLMRLACMAVLACTATLMLADTSSAASRKLSGTHSAGEVKSACDANGGTYSQNYNSYTCVGTAGSVTCSSNGSCYGSCKKCASVKGGLNGVLRPPASAGTASAAGGTASNKKPPLHSVNQPVVLQHSGGARSGGSKH